MFFSDSHKARPAFSCVFLYFTGESPGADENPRPPQGKPSTLRGEGAPVRTLGRMRGRGGQAVLTVRSKKLPRTLIRHGFAVPPSPWEGEGFGRVPGRGKKAGVEPLPYMTHPGISPPKGSPLVGELSRGARLRGRSVTEGAEGGGKLVISSKKKRAVFCTLPNFSKA